LSEGRTHGVDADPLAGPAAIACRVACLAAVLGYSAEEVLDESALACSAGIPPESVARLLAGGQSCERGVEERFVQRLRDLHSTHVKPNGKKFLHREIAAQAQMSRQQVTALLAGERQPSAAHQFYLEEFFGVRHGYLTATDSDALCQSLSGIELTLHRELFKRFAALYVKQGSTNHAATTSGFPLPAPAEWRARREALGLDLPELAQSLGVDADTVRAWEEGYEPGGGARNRYARFLDAASCLAGLIDHQTR
jgi:transcriptional regulator with XRE-family HTH domain